MHGDAMNRKIYRIRIIALTFFILSILWTVPVSAEEKAGEPENLYARSAVLMDADSGRILYGKDGQNIMPMASTTKIMTCIIALEEMKESQTGEASQNAALQPKVRMGVKEGEVYYLKDLLYAMMLESYNDSAVIIAEELGGSVEAFAEKMNQKVKEIGCEHTHFVTPNGLDGKDSQGIHATTAEDLAGILRYCIMISPEKSRFLEITGTRNYQFSDVSGTRQFACTNHNAFLDMMEGALTGKTGFTADAGYCYVGALKRGDRTFIVALLACGWPDHKNYKWSDTRKLMEYGIDNYEYQEIPLNLVPDYLMVKEGFDSRSPYDGSCIVETETNERKDVLRILLNPEEQVKIETDYMNNLTAPVDKGAVVGELRCCLGDQILYRCDIVTKSSVEARSLLHCMSMVADAFCFVQMW